MSSHNDNEGTITLQHHLDNLHDTLTSILWNIKYKSRNITSMTDNKYVPMHEARKRNLYSLIDKYNEEINRVELNNKLEEAGKLINEIKEEVTTFDNNVKKANKLISKYTLSTGLQKLAKTQVKKNIDAGLYLKTDIPDFVHPILDAPDRVLDMNSKSRRKGGLSKTKKNKSK